MEGAPHTNGMVQPPGLLQREREFEWLGTHCCDRASAARLRRCASGMMDGAPHLRQQRTALLDQPLAGQPAQFHPPSSSPRCAAVTASRRASCKESQQRDPSRPSTSISTAEVPLAAISCRQLVTRWSWKGGGSAATPRGSGGDGVTVRSSADGGGLGEAEPPSTTAMLPGAEEPGW